MIKNNIITYINGLFI